MGEGTILILSVHISTGGTPSCWQGGTPKMAVLPSQVRIGSTPVTDQDREYPHPRSRQGCPYPRSGWGFSHLRSGLGGTPPVQVPGQDRNTIVCTWYAVGGLPPAFTQGEFLDLFCLQIIVNVNLTSKYFKNYTIWNVWFRSLALCFQPFRHCLLVWDFFLLV